VTHIECAPKSDRSGARSSEPADNASCIHLPKADSYQVDFSGVEPLIGTALKPDCPVSQAPISTGTIDVELRHDLTIGVRRR
jgi:hypothetical protein